MTPSINNINIKSPFEMICTFLNGIKEEPAKEEVKKDPIIIKEDSDELDIPKAFLDWQKNKNTKKWGHE